MELKLFDNDVNINVVFFFSDFSEEKVLAVGKRFWQWKFGANPIMELTTLY